MLLSSCPSSSTLIDGFLISRYFQRIFLEIWTSQNKKTLHSTHVFDQTHERYQKNRWLWKKNITIAHFCFSKTYSSTGGTDVPRLSSSAVDGKTSLLMNRMILSKFSQLLSLLFRSPGKHDVRIVPASMLDTKKKSERLNTCVATCSKPHPTWTKNCDCIQSQEPNIFVFLLFPMDTCKDACSTHR